MERPIIMDAGNGMLTNSMTPMLAASATGFRCLIRIPFMSCNSPMLPYLQARVEMETIQGKPMAYLERYSLNIKVYLTLAGNRNL